MRLYLDTNVLIALNEGIGPERLLIEQLLAKGAAGGMRFVTSTLTFSELLVRPYRDGMIELARTYHSLSSGQNWLSVVPVSQEVLDLAALIRARHTRTKLPDAIHLASAIRHGCDGLLSADLGISDLDTLDHPLHGTLQGSHMSVFRPDRPTLASLIEGMNA